jgi:phage repressor protein C with HTH and peptisase S24 domain
MDGDMLIYDEHCCARRADGQECVVGLADGRRFVKIVRDERDGTVTLESWNAPPIRRVVAEWIALIVWVKRG